MRRRAAIVPATFALVIIGLACLSGKSSDVTEDSPRHNILIIVVDTLRPDHLGCYGYKRDTSPNIDRLAGESLLFEQARSTSSWTLPSMMSMFTGLNCRRHGVLDYRHRLKESIPTLAQLLRTHGYSTAGVVSTPTLEGQYGFGNGFDTYDDQSYKLSYEGLEDFGPDDSQLQGSRDMVSSPLIAKLASNRLTQLTQERKPWMLFVHYMDPHFNYVPPPPFDQRYDPGYKGAVDGRDVKYSKTIRPGVAPEDLKHLVALYDGEIRHNDEQIGALLTALKESGQMDNTIIVLTADHGEEFLEHGSTGHGETLYEEVVRIPLIMRIPGRTPARISAPSSLIDVLPTLAGILRVPLTQEVDGIDISGTNDSSRSFLIDVDVEGHMTAIFRDGKKLITDFEEQSMEFYDIRMDPGEKSPLNQQAALQDELKAKILEYRASGVEPIRRRTNAVSDKTLEEIKNLGYVQ